MACFVSSVSIVANSFHWIFIQWHMITGFAHTCRFLLPDKLPATGLGILKALYFQMRCVRHCYRLGTRKLLQITACRSQADGRDVNICSCHFPGLLQKVFTCSCQPEVRSLNMAERGHVFITRCNFKRWQAPACRCSAARRVAAWCSCHLLLGSRLSNCIAHHLNQGTGTNKGLPVLFRSCQVHTALDHHFAPRKKLVQHLLTGIEQALHGLPDLQRVSTCNHLAGKYNFIYTHDLPSNLVVSPQTGSRLKHITSHPASPDSDLPLKLECCRVAFISVSSYFTGAELNLSCVPSGFARVLSE